MRDAVGFNEIGSAEGTITVRQLSNLGLGIGPQRLNDLNPAVGQAHEDAALGAASAARSGVDRIEQRCRFVLSSGAARQIQHATLIVRLRGCLAFEADGLLLGVAFEGQFD